MQAWAANASALFILLGFLLLLAFALLWRVTSWRTSAVQLLVHDEGLRIGAEAPQIAAYAGEQEVHLSFGGPEAFVVFGTRGCAPCEELLDAAARHPATRHLRRVYVADSEAVDVGPDVLGAWEIFRFHDERVTRKRWRAPVSPYFHVIDTDGRIVSKGVANRPEHLDRLLAIAPSGIRSLENAALLEPLLTQRVEEGV